MTTESLYVELRQNEESQKTIEDLFQTWYREDGWEETGVVTYGEFRIIQSTSFLGYLEHLIVAIDPNGCINVVQVEQGMQKTYPVKSTYPFNKHSFDNTVQFIQDGRDLNEIYDNW